MACFTYPTPSFWWLQEDTMADCLDCAFDTCENCDDEENGCCCGRIRRCQNCGLVRGPGAAPVCFGDCEEADA